MSGEWPLEDIADVLGGELKEVKPGVWKLNIPSKPLGTSLELHLSPKYGAVRLTPERNKKAGPWTIGTITYFTIAAVTVYPGEGEVAFRTGDDPPVELLVSHLGQFRLVGGIDPAKVNRVEAATADTEAVTVVGHLARPFFTDAKKAPFWMAGLAEQIDGADQPIWHQVKAFGHLARTANRFAKGQQVKVTGTRRLERWEKDGEMHTGYSLLLSAIEPV